MISTIVVGTDGSRTAQRAVGVAAELARGLGATLHLVHGYHAPATLEGAGAAVAGTARTTSSRWEEMSEALLEAAAADPVVAGLAIERHSEPIGAWQAIVAVAERVGADLVVVGNRGMRGTGESVPDAVVVHAPCHVLVARTT